jgi:hypothetical protein
MLAEDGGKVSQAKITLMLKTHEKDGPRGVALRRSYLGVDEREL